MPGKPFPELKIVAHFRTARINSHVTASTEGQPALARGTAGPFRPMRTIRYSSNGFDQRGR